MRSSSFAFNIFLNNNFFSEHCDNECFLSYYMTYLDQANSIIKGMHMDHANRAFIRSVGLNQFPFFFSSKCCASSLRIQTFIRLPLCHRFHIEISVASSQFSHFSNECFGLPFLLPQLILSCIILLTNISDNYY